MKTKSLPKIDKVALIHASLSDATDYDTYRELVRGHVAKKTSTGPEQTEALSHYTMLNDRRMKRWGKTLKFTEQEERTIKNFRGHQLWIVLTESWCADASQSMPVMYAIAAKNPNIVFKVLLRDENLELMDAFLTHESRSIPKLIVLDRESNKLMGSWGPRPSIVTQIANNYKRQHGSLTPEFKEDLQIWYNKDKGQNIKRDLLQFLV